MNGIKEKDDLKKDLETKLNAGYTDQYLRDSVSASYELSWGEKMAKFEEKYLWGASYSGFPGCIDSVKKNIQDVYNSKIKVKFGNLETEMNKYLSEIFESLFKDNLKYAGDDVSQRNEVLKSFKDFKGMPESVCKEKMVNLYANSLEDLLKYTNQLIAECVDKFPLEAMEEEDVFLASLEFLQLQTVSQIENVPSGDCRDTSC